MNIRTLGSTKRMATSLLIGLIVATLSAVTPAFAGGTTTSGIITRLDMLQDGVRVLAPAITDNPDGCVQTGYYFLGLAHPNYEATVAALIGAQHAGKSVYFYVSGCAGYPLISNTYVVTG